MRYLVLALLVIVNGAAAADPSAQEIVSATDKVRNPGKPFRLTSTLTEYVAGKPRDRVVLVVYAKEDPATRQFKNLVRYAEPPRDKGKMVLLDGTRMWFYDPASKVSIRISPQQRLVGQASNGDVVTVNLARDYKAAIAGEETLKDADRQDRACWRLELAAATEDAIYSRIEYWVERSSFRPVKGKYYSDSGRLLKIAYFRDYRDELGVARPTETIIIDAVDPSLVTTMKSSDYRFETIPEAWFQREFLPRLKAD
jgi:Outer membrane lipoprotein-sorting protein